MRNKIVASATAFFEEVRNDPKHLFRDEFDRMVRPSSTGRHRSDLCPAHPGPEAHLLARPELADLARHIWANARSFFERSASGETQVLEQYLVRMFVTAGEALAADAEMRAEINQGLVAVLRRSSPNRRAACRPSSPIRSNPGTWDS